MTPEQLRTSILQYAMEGKLVKQDSNDEPASELVKRSQDKKIELIKNGELKKSKKLPVITDGEKPFNIPDNWAWSRLGDLFTILRGGSPRPIKSFLTNDENGINWIKISDTDPNSKYITKTEEKIIPEGLKKSRAVHIGDFVLSNSMSFGRPYILKINGAVHDGWLIISDYDQVFNKDFLYYLLLSSFVKKQFSIAATGSTVKNLNRERVANTIGVIPPLEEQKRIVAKIEKLMPLVDEYAESYNRLQKIDNEFEDKLKQSVLQYAMEGKLIKQDPNDEPASELIKKIKNEKAELIKEGKIKKSQKLPVITDDEKPFDIPDSWEWVRLGNIGDWGAGATPSRQHPEYYGGDVLWLKTGDLNDGVIQDTSEKITEAGVANSSVKVNQPGNILIAMYGATIGKLGIVGKTLVTNQACCGCTPFKGIYNLYTRGAS
jgi:type I restriction enzyme S subunit